MRFFLLLSLFIPNFLQIIKLLTISQTVFLSIYLINTKMITWKHIFNNLTIVIIDISIKNNIAKSISHIHIHNNLITKTFYYIVYIMSIEAELFTIRYGINQVMNCNDISKIIVICHIQVHLSGKLHPHSDATSEPYKLVFYGGHLFHNTSYGSAATFRIFHLLWWEYSYSTQSSMTELLLSVSQHWNLHSEQ